MLDSDGLTVSLRRRAPREHAGGAGASVAPAASRVPGWLRSVLRVPLPAKLIGANGLVALVAAAALAGTAEHGSRTDATIVAAALVLGLAVNCLLIHWALRPVWELERVAGRVWRGDLQARVASDPVADPHMSRVGRTFNLLLDSLEDDRERMRVLAQQTLRAQDDERSRIARELHDSTAQTIAALGYQLSAAAREAADAGHEPLRERLAETRELAGTVLEEVRLLSHAIHPRVLDDLGLVPALEWLARQSSQHGRLAVEVDDRLGDVAESLSGATASALYRIAQESLRNAERHAGTGAARVALAVEGDEIVLEVTDDGRGFDIDEAEERRPGMGLFSMRERAGLVGGSLDVDTAPGRGTRVRVRAPLAFEGPRLSRPFMPPAPELR